MPSNAYNPTAEQPYQAYQPPPIAPPPPSPVAPANPPFQFTGAPNTKLGNIAGSLDNLFRGYMQGKAQRAANITQQFQAKSDNLRASYEQDAQRLFALSQAGTDPSSDEYKMAVSAVNGSWGALRDWREKIVNGPDGDKPKKSKKKTDQSAQQPPNPQQQLQQVMQDLQSPDPQVKAAAALKIQQKLGAPVMWQVKQFYTPEAIAARQTQQQAAQNQQTESGIQSTTDNAIKEYQEISNTRPSWHTIGSPSTPRLIIVGGNNTKPEGMKAPGNVNLNYRPTVHNPETGGDSSVWSTSFGTDKGEVLVPRVTNGEDGLPPHILSDKRIDGKPSEAEEYYNKYHQFLGIFDTPEHATAYAQKLHEQQSALPDTEQRLRQLENVIVPGGRRGAYKIITGSAGEKKMSVLQNTQTGEITDLSLNPLPEDVVNSFVADKTGAVKAAQVKRVGKSMVSITDADGNSWTPDQIKDGKGGVEVQALYKSELDAEDKERAEAREKAQQWYSHANYSDTLQTRRALRALGLKASAADIKNWSTVEAKANNTEEQYQEASNAAKKPTPTSDTKLLMTWVKSNVQGAGRMTTVEIQQGLKSGSFGTRLENDFDRATAGTFDPGYRADLIGDLRNAAQANRQKADELKEEYGLDDDTLKAIADAQGKGGGKPESSGKFDVTDPKGKVHHFDSQEQADDFKKLAGIK